MNWRETIEFRPPYQTAYFAGTNTRVLRIMLCLVNGWTENQILMMHPEIRMADIDACLMYGASCIGQDFETQIDSRVVEAFIKAQSTTSVSRPAFD